MSAKRQLTPCYVDSSTAGPCSIAADSRRDRKGPSRKGTALLASNPQPVSYSLVLQRRGCPERSRRVAYPASPARPPPRSSMLPASGTDSSTAGPCSVAADSGRKREGPSRRGTALLAARYCAAYSLVLHRRACPERSRKVAHPASLARPSPSSRMLRDSGTRSSASSTAASRCVLGRHRRPNHAVVARWQCGHDDQLHLARIEPGHIQRSLSRPGARAGGGLATVCHPSFEDVCPLPDPLVRGIDHS